MLDDAEGEKIRKKEEKIKRRREKQME